MKNSILTTAAMALVLSAAHVYPVMAQGQQGTAAVPAPAAQPTVIPAAPIPGMTPSKPSSDEAAVPPAPAVPATPPAAQTPAVPATPTTAATPAAPATPPVPATASVNPTAPQPAPGTVVPEAAPVIPDIQPLPEAAPPAPKMVGGAEMSAARPLLENLKASKDHATFVKAVEAAGLSQTLAGEGPFTVFAPTDAAFGKLPSTALNNLLKAQNKDKLVKLLNYHVVAGSHTQQSIMADIAAAGGTTTYQTVAGANIMLTAAGNALTITDENGNKAQVTIADAPESNGILHVIDTVLIPK